MLLSKGYKAKYLKAAIEYGMQLDRDQALEKVTREEGKNDH